eukprot:SAG31_NODE_19712_length_593_cov_1.617409_1_plen_131_part_00
MAGWAGGRIIFLKKINGMACMVRVRPAVFRSVASGFFARGWLLRSHAQKVECAPGCIMSIDSRRSQPRLSLDVFMLLSCLATLVKAQVGCMHPLNCTERCAPWAATDLQLVGGNLSNGNPNTSISFRIGA